MLTTDVLNLMNPQEIESRMIQIILGLTAEIEHLKWKVSALDNKINKTFKENSK